MPNWCNNTLKVTGNPEQLKDFLSKTVTTNEDGREQFTMNGLYPTPPELLDEQPFPQADVSDEEIDIARRKRSDELAEKYGHSDWYMWRISNWGCKWDIGECYVIENNEDFFQVSFDSPWSPPLTFLKYASEQYPELDFSILFDEPGMEFCGLYRVGRAGQDETVAEGTYVYTDDQDREVEFDSDNQKWKYLDTNELIEEEDFWPIGVNPYEEDF